MHTVYAGYMYNDDPLASKNTVRALVLVLGTYIAVLLGCSIRSRLDSYRQCDLYYLPTSLCRCFGAPACRVFPRDHLITYNLLTALQALGVPGWRCEQSKGFNGLENAWNFLVGSRARELRCFRRLSQEV